MRKHLNSKEIIRSRGVLSDELKCQTFKDIESSALLSKVASELWVTITSVFR
jgi:hypothetical protein